MSKEGWFASIVCFGISVLFGTLALHLDSGLVWWASGFGAGVGMVIVMMERIYFRRRR